MKQRVLAICDSEDEYAYRLMEYLNEKKDHLFCVHVFSGFEALCAFAGKHSVEVLLVSQQLLNFPWQDSKAACIFVLAEGEGEKTELPVIYKYQSADQIMREVMRLYAESADGGLMAALLKKKVEFIGIYSQIGRIGKTSFALALGSELAKKRKTLYLNLEEYSGFETLYPSCDGWTLSELLYFLDQGKKAFAYKLGSVVQNFGNLDYIPPLKSPVELRHVSGREWEYLLEQLVTESYYETIILDLGGAVNGLLELLAKCVRIYMPIRRDAISEAKLLQYEGLLRQTGYEELLERTEKFQLPTEEEDLEKFIKNLQKQWENE